MNFRKPYPHTLHRHTLLLILLASSLVHAAESERMEYDAQTGNYVVYYFSHMAPGVLQRVVVEPATKIDPIVRSGFKLKEHGNVVLYQYKVRSAITSRQPLIGFRYETNNVEQNTQKIP